MRIDDTDALYLFSEADLVRVATMASTGSGKTDMEVLLILAKYPTSDQRMYVYTIIRKVLFLFRMIQNRTDGWEYSMDQMLDIFKKASLLGISEVHIVGVLPQYDLVASNYFLPC